MKGGPVHSLSLALNCVVLVFLRYHDVHCCFDVLLSMLLSSVFPHSIHLSHTLLLV